MTRQGEMPPARTLTGESRGLTFPQKVVEPHKRPIFQVQHMLQYYLIIAPRGKVRKHQRRAGFSHQSNLPYSAADLGM